MLMLGHNNYGIRDRFRSWDPWVMGEHHLYAKFSRCEFWLDQVVFLGHMVSKDKIIVDPKKVEAVLHWERPKTATEIYSFLGLAS